MKEPSGEIVGLNFYFGDRSCPDGMRDVASFCLDNGAMFSGEIMVRESDGARNIRMSSKYNEYVSEKKIANKELVRQLESIDAHVTKVGLWNAIGLSKRSPEIVTFNGISADAPSDESNPIAIVGEGWHFSTPGYEKERDNDARRCYARFIGICKALQPTYAAILNEDSLTCPFDLKRGRGSDCFVNFFVSEQAIGSSLISRLMLMYPDAYTERFPEGLYVATWMFAPKEIAVDRKSVKERSKQVATMITSVAYGTGKTQPRS